MVIYAGATMPTTSMTFSQFIELLLARLYDLDREHGPRYFNLTAVAQELKESVPSAWVFDSAKVLQRSGWARCAFTFGAVHAELTGEGRLFVEREEGRTGVIEDYHRNPSHYVVVSGSGNQVNVAGGGQTVTQTMTVEQERAPVFELLRELEQGINGDRSLGEREKHDMLADVEAIRQQLRKREPNMGALAAILQPLSQISSIAGGVASLIKLLNQ